MLRTNQYLFYELGAALHPLSQFTDKTTVGHAFLTVENARNWLTKLLNRQLVPVSVSRSSAQDLAIMLNNFAEENYTDKSTRRYDLSKFDDSLSFWWPGQFRTAVETLEHVLAAELQTLPTYYVPKRGIYSTEDLVESADQAFPHDVIPVIGTDACNDFRSAGKCLAFELPTASAFHVFRAVESVLRKYHRHFAGPSASKMRNWGVYLRILRECSGDHTPDPKVLDLVDQIRLNHRNPLIHPEAFLGLDEALILFDIGKSAIVAMALDLQKASSAGPLLPLQIEG